MCYFYLNENTQKTSWFCVSVKYNTIISCIQWCVEQSRATGFISLCSCFLLPLCLTGKFFRASCVSHCVVLPVYMSVYILPETMISYYRLDVLSTCIMQITIICCQNNSKQEHKLPCLPVDFCSHCVFCNTSSQR